MLKFRKVVSADRILAAFVAIVMMVSLTIAANIAPKENTTETCGCNYSEKTFYFKDATLTTVVGQDGYFCDGTYFSSGKRTRFSESLYCWCEDI